MLEWFSLISLIGGIICLIGSPIYYFFVNIGNGYFSPESSLNYMGIGFLLIILSWIFSLISSNNFSNNSCYSNSSNCTKQDIVKDHKDYSQVGATIAGVALGSVACNAIDKHMENHRNKLLEQCRKQRIKEDTE